MRRPPRIYGAPVALARGDARRKAELVN